LCLCLFCAVQLKVEIEDFIEKRPYIQRNVSVNELDWCDSGGLFCDAAAIFSRKIGPLQPPNFAGITIIAILAQQDASDWPIYAVGDPLSATPQVRKMRVFLHPSHLPPVLLVPILIPEFI
ncbi:AAEL012927-PB, partial [Aedes aegypti]